MVKCFLDDICDYLPKFKVADNLKKADLDLMCQYIQDLVKNENELTSWRVVLMNKKGSVNSQHTFSNGIKVGCSDRTRADYINWDTYFIKNNNIVGNQKDEFIDLDNELMETALGKTREYKAKQGKDWGKNYPFPEVVRQEFRPRTNPLFNNLPAQSRICKHKR